MKLIKVIPFSRSIHKESLSYFTAKDIAVGTIVSVPVRRKLVDAFVIETKDLLASKFDIKSSTFNLKKVESIKGPSFLNPEFVAAAQITSRYFVSHPGQVINALVPAPFLKNYKNIQLPNIRKKSSQKKESETKKLILQKPLSDRLLFYKTLIRDSFDDGHSIFICLPTISDIRFFTSSLEKDIKDYFFVFHSELSAKNQIEKFNEVIREEHPVFIIATGSYLFIPRDDIRTIIIEHESSSAYRTISRPFLDMRTFAEIFANETGAKFILADTLLRTETIWRHEQDELGEVVAPKFNMPSLNKVKVIDMRTSQKHENTKIKKQKMGFEVLSEEVKKFIKKTISSNEQMFLFVLRKGLAPITVCNDCGTTLLCENCNVPLVLHEKTNKYNKERIFKCNRCKKEQSAKTVCGECGSWNLVPLGIGIDKVVKTIKQEFPEVQLFQLDKENVKTAKQAKKIIEQFHDTPGGILVGTKMALSYLQGLSVCLPKSRHKQAQSGKIKNTAIISFDSLFSIPSFRINEKIVHLILNLLQYTEKNLLIQTRNPEEKVLEYISNNNLSQFYKDELEQRHQFKYPPFITLIKVTFAGNKQDTDNAVKIMKDLFGEYNPEIFKAYIPRIKNQYVTNMVIKFTPTAASGIDSENWPPDAKTIPGTDSASLLQKLYLLPPSWTIKVDPENLL